ncbi:hypothetical protein HHX47_DHR2000672 [Lentinula edodes]|nr:hypothetical protein HHX47_DHR2000672 [Lentinula edodes]
MHVVAEPHALLIQVLNFMNSTMDYKVNEKHLISVYQTTSSVGPRTHIPHPITPKRITRANIVLVASIPTGTSSILPGNAVQAVRGFIPVAAVIVAVPIDGTTVGAGRERG